MIPLSELREGYYVFDKDGAAIVYKEKYAQEDSNVRINLANKLIPGNKHKDILVDISPIPLIPEQLDQFGFKEVSSDNKNKRLFCIGEGKRQLNIQMDEEGYHVAIGIDQTVGRRFNFVHQLQDIYRALIGEDLEIKE